VRAFGYGRAWDTRLTHGEDRWQPASEVTADLSLGGYMEEEEPSAVSDGLPVCRETETLQRAGESVSAWLGRSDAQTLTPEQRRARAKLSPAQMESLWAWERANPLHKGQQRNPRRPREFEHWKRTRSGQGVQVVRPLHTMDQCAIEALAGIAKPLQSTLLLYALQDGRYWLTVERHARAMLPSEAHAGIPEGMFRLLTDPPKRARAKALKMRETEWDAMSRPALHLFESWIERAAETFMQQLDKPPPITGSQGNGHRAETWWRPIEPSAVVRGGPPASRTA
jgi:hypothetical protein